MVNNKLRLVVIMAVWLMLATGAASLARAQYSTTPTPSWHDYGVMRQQTLNGWRARNRMRQRQVQRNHAAMNMHSRRHGRRHARH